MRVQGGARSIRMGTFDYGLHLVQGEQKYRKEIFFSKSSNLKRIPRFLSIRLKEYYNLTFRFSSIASDVEQYQDLNLPPFLH